MLGGILINAMIWAAWIVAFLLGLGCIWAAVIIFRFERWYRIEYPKDRAQSHLRSVRL